MFYRRLGKRIFDVALTLPAIVVSAPLMAVTALAVRKYHGSPVIFAQERPGFRGEIFRMYKFRTMTNERDADGLLLPDDKRLTRFGQFLRATSLDELPELWNVLRGEMSLVGPRPLLVEYLKFYSAEQARRHDVMPGITGWAQVMGRNSLSWEDKFRLDVDYVDNVSLGRDFHVLFLTVGTVLRRKGVQADGFATMPAFRGTAEGTSSSAINLHETGTKRCEL